MHLDAVLLDRRGRWSAKNIVYLNEFTEHFFQFWNLNSFQIMVNNSEQQKYKDISIKCYDIHILLSFFSIAHNMRFMWYLYLLCLKVWDA